jgi:hypothetical protein
MARRSRPHGRATPEFLLLINVQIRAAVPRFASVSRAGLALALPSRIVELFDLTTGSLDLRTWLKQRDEAPSLN